MIGDDGMRVFKLSLLYYGIAMCWFHMMFVCAYIRPSVRACVCASVQCVGMLCLCAFMLEKKRA